MAEQVGILLWQMRTTGGWTLGKLAQKAGVSKAALSQWEAGKHQPRVAELEAVMEALNAPAAQRALVFARIEAPRAIRHLRREVTAGGVAPPTAGDLLRAMRLRKRWSQERLAANVEVDRTSIVRWERSERLPDNGYLHRLCYALEAHEEELLALTQGHFNHSSPKPSPSHWEEQAQLLSRRLEELLWEGGELLALRWLTLEKDAWQLAMQHEATKLLLAEVLVCHAWYYRNLEQWDEITIRVQRALALIPSQQAGSDIRSLAALMNAAALVHAGAREAPERGIAELQQRLAYSTPKYTAWMLADMAKYAAMARQTDTSLVLSERAYQTVEREEFHTEAHLRRCDHGSLLLEAGRPEEALCVLPPTETLSIWAQINIQLLMVEAHRQLEHPGEAHDHLQQAFGLIVNYSEMEVWRPKADLLAQSF